MYRIGIDLGGTNIAVGLVSEDGKILRKAETPTLAKRPYADIVRDMAACIAKLLDEAKLTTQDIAAIGIAPAYARAPGGQWQRMGSYGVGWPLIQWTAEAQDWSGGDQGPDAYRTANTIAASTKDGGIILMHDMKINSAKATEMFIPKLEERGFMLLTVDELFAKDGVTLEANQAYWRCLDGVTTQY